MKADTSPAGHPTGAPAPSAQINLAAAERAVADLLLALGYDPESEPLALTPQRVALNLREHTERREYHITTFPNPGDTDEAVVVRDIAFASLCEHHLLPFRGIAHVGYVPGELIIGLSTMPHVVEHFARGLQVQERLTAQIADALQEHLGSPFVGVTLEAEHTCMSTRGARALGTTTVTQAFRGELRGNSEFRALLHPVGAASND